MDKLDFTPAKYQTQIFKNIYGKYNLEQSLKEHIYKGYRVAAMTSINDSSMFFVIYDIPEHLLPKKEIYDNIRN